MSPSQMVDLRVASLIESGRRKNRMTQPRQEHPHNQYWLAEAEKAIARTKQAALMPGTIGVHVVELHQVDGILKRVVQKSQTEPLPYGKQEKA